MATVLLTVGLAGSHLARALFTCALVALLLACVFFLMLARNLFTFGLAGLHVDRLLFIALHLAWVLFICC